MSKIIGILIAVINKARQKKNVQLSMRKMKLNFTMEKYTGDCSEVAVKGSDVFEAVGGVVSPGVHHTLCAT